MKSIITFLLLLGVVISGMGLWSEGEGAYINRCKYLINVKEYGAVGDGVTDDTDAIRYALDNAATRGAGEPRVVFFPVGEYVISKPIFVGRYSTSENGQGSFSWAGETHYWGGGAYKIKTGLHLIGETDASGGVSKIVYKNMSSYPMFVLTFSANIKIEKLQLDGQYDGSHARASEGLFLTGTSNGFILEQSVIQECKRGLRLGDFVHWPEDPVIFSNYVVQDEYPTMHGGWMVEQLLLQTSRIVSCDTAISFETAQTVHCVLNNMRLHSDSTGGECIYLRAGRFAMYECHMSGTGRAGIYSPATNAGGDFQIFSGRSEMANGISFKKDKSYEGGGWGSHRFSFRDFNGQSLEVKGLAQLLLDGGDYENIDLLENSNEWLFVQVVDIRNATVRGRVGQKANESSAWKVIFSAENVIFTGEGMIDSPWNGYFDRHRVNKIVNCRFAGGDFTESVNRFAGGGMRMSVADGSMGHSQYNLGAAFDTTNSIYASSTEMGFLKSAYRRAGNLYAGGALGSKSSQGASSWSFGTFSGETEDSTVDTWNERFGVENNGAIWTVKTGGRRVGWSGSAPSSGVWSRGDIVYNSSVSSSGTYAWIYTGSGWRQLQ